MIAGVPVGKEIPEGSAQAEGLGSSFPTFATEKSREDGARGILREDEGRGILPGSDSQGDVGSIIIVIATDAPLLPHQLKRLAKRASLGLARTGSVSGNSSGDIFIAFSTANPYADAAPGPNIVHTVSNDRITPLFTATVEATEEAIVNAMVGAKTMTGIDGHTVVALPHEQLQQVLKKYNR